MKKKEKLTLAKIIISILLFITAVIIKSQGYLELAIYLAAYIIIGYDVVIDAFKSLFRGKMLDENFLMTIASIGAFAVGEYPEAIMVMTLYQVGELFQSYAVGKSRKSISQLMDIRPDSASVIKDGKWIQTDAESVQIGDIIGIKAGERIPLDAVVENGKASIDTSALTGESVPRYVTQGDEILSGCINLDGMITAKVTKGFSESTASKILDLVENANAKKAPSEKFITRFAKYYTPLVVLFAVLLAVIPPLVISGAVFSDWAYRALTFLVISCPCALVISVPMSFFGGIGGASKKGILIKGGNYIDLLAKTETVVFDKTGTLTKGRFEISQINAVDISQEDLIKYAAYAEYYSNHPIANAIKKSFTGEINDELIEDYKEHAGYGISAKIDGEAVLAGNAQLLIKSGIEPQCAKIGTSVHLAVNGEYKGYITIEDVIKETSKEAISGLKKAGIERTVMLTGDSEDTAQRVSNMIGIDQFHAKLLPQGKVRKIEKLLAQKRQNKSIVFVGDGINDAPVITRADVGIAMGAMGSDAAIEAADIVIMDDNPLKILDAINISKATLRIVRQNIIFALGIKAIFLLLGAFGIATMWEAVFADVGVSIIAILNAMRTLKMK